ncbi:hypothetical protein GGI20_003572 [Coemansia sp. BCRC 34301]|nr:hypothetical protein GGI20_003572 [Coemansia sp. BCRC 34301]
MGRLPEYMRSTYAPMGARFRCWHVNISLKCKYARVAICALLLALLCPNFCYAAVDRLYCKEFMAEMNKQIAKPVFIQHAPRLRRLLFNGFDDDSDSNDDSDSDSNDSDD